ncbi:MAG: uracil-DNA glycosylase family protein [Leptolyngbyaceae bacterium]|nr:uracil-DNA glycosylase family protein [Leptolyngbyaceae bacterium]
MSLLRFMQELLNQIKACDVCKGSLPHHPRPVLAASPASKIVVIGQAPGKRVHESGVPWDDQSGMQLREWLGVTRHEFYTPENFAILPMGFCYPGKGKSGDLPPRSECAPLWHSQLLDRLTNRVLVLLVGHYAQRYYLKEAAQKTLTATVKNYNAYLPTYLPLPHPSPRNRFWFKKNEWFAENVVPELKKRVSDVLSHA